MTLYYQRNAGGSNGVTVAAGSGGSADGSIPYTGVNIGTAATLAYSNAHPEFNNGDLAVQFATGATSTSAYAFWDSTSITFAKAGGYSLDLYFTANPAATFRIATILQGVNVQGTLSIASGGKLQWFDNAGTGGGAMTNSIPLNQWFRIRFKIVTFSTTAATYEIELYTNVLDTTPLEVKPSSVGALTTFNTSTPDQIRVGHSATNTANQTAAWFRNLQADTTGYPAIPPAEGIAAVAPAVAVAATGAKGSSTGAAIAPVATVAATGATSMSSGAAVSPAVAITAAGAASFSTGAAIAPAVAIASAGVVGKSTGAAITPAAAITAAGTAGLSTGAAVAPNAAVAATGAAGLSTGATVAPFVAITAAGTAVTGLTGTSAVTPSVATAATGATGTATTAAIAPSATIAAGGAAGKSTGSAIAASIAVVSAGGVAASGVAAIAPTVAVSPTGRLGLSTGAALVISAAVSAAGGVGGTGQAATILPVGLISELLSNDTASVPMALRCPDGVQDGDLLIAFIGDLTSSPGITTPVGWQLYGGSLVSTSTNQKAGCYIRTASVTAPDSFGVRDTPNTSAGSNNGSLTTWAMPGGRAEGAMLAFRHVDATTPIVSFNTASSATATTSLPYATVTPTRDGSYIIGAAFAHPATAGTQTTFIPPTNYAEDVDNCTTSSTVGNLALQIISKQQQTAAAISGLVSTASASSLYSTFLVALNPSTVSSNGVAQPLVTVSVAVTGRTGAATTAARSVVASITAAGTASAGATALFGQTSRPVVVAIAAAGNVGVGNSRVWFNGLNPSAIYHGSDLVTAMYVGKVKVWG